MPTISDFAAKFKGGVRPNLFRVNLFGGGAFFSDMEFLAKTTTLPDSTKIMVQPISLWQQK